MLRREIDHLAADHAPAPGRHRHRPDELATNRRIGVHPGIGRELEGERQQRIPGEDGRRLVEGDVA